MSLKKSPDAKKKPKLHHAKYYSWFLVIYFKVYFNSEISVWCLCSCGDWLF